MVTQILKDTGDAYKYAEVEVTVPMKDESD
jgi:hypothetical protein